MLHSDENDKRNWYDTGASLLEDVLEHRPRLKGLHVDIRPMVEHLGGASYRTLKGQAEWLTKHKDLWQAPADAPKPSFDEAQGTPAPKKPRAKKTKAKE
jgi:hypothetical protein